MEVSSLKTRRFNELLAANGASPKQFSVEGGELKFNAGANAGFASRQFAEMLPGARIVPVEAEAGNYAVLRKNTAHYPGVLALHAAM